ncbi:hypothetical protein CHARACLAT_032655, partial [Characodon lateralis]|nr:hypothetical protein [Characodon lateralis]
MVPPAGGGPTGGWHHVSPLGLAWPGPARSNPAIRRSPTGPDPRPGSRLGRKWGGERGKDIRHVDWDSHVRFVSRVEEIINEWKLTDNHVEELFPEKGAYINGTWGEQSQDVHFADFKFYITHHFLKEECKKNGKGEE